MIFDGFPSEIWQIIFTFLDLETQLSLSRLSKEFHLITSSLWRIKLVKTLRNINLVPLDYNEARTNMAMISFLNDKKKPLENYSLYELHDILCKYNHLTSLSGTLTTNTSRVRHETILKCNIQFKYLFFSILSSTTMTIRIVNTWI